MDRKIYLDGNIVDRDKAVVSVFDHGLLYGDGVFEGIRAYEGNVFKLKQHIDRLYASARVIKLEIPLDKAEMEKAVVDTVNSNKLRDAYIRLVVTRGVGDLGLNPLKCTEPTVFIIADKIILYPDEYYQKGLKIITASVRRNIPDALNPRIKSLNYLNNILAKIEANHSGVPEALMLNKDGYVAECTGDNIFIISQADEVFTPPAYLGSLSGITKKTVMDILQEKGYKVFEIPFTLFEVYNAKECFLTGTAAEVIPVAEIDDRKIGTGEPGSITLDVLKEFRNITKIEGTKL